MAATLHQALWSWRYWRVDPWSEKSPVQWTATTDHVSRLDGLLRRTLDGVPRGSVLAVSPDPTFAEQGFYLYLWTAFLLPELEVRRVTRPEEGLSADYWLVFGQADSGDRPLLPAELLGSDRLRPVVRREASLLPPATLYETVDPGDRRRSDGSDGDAAPSPGPSAPGSGTP